MHLGLLLTLKCPDCSQQDMGTVILGKLESGSISKAQQLVMMPNRVRSLCDSVPSLMGTVNLLEGTPMPYFCMRLCCIVLFFMCVLQHTVEVLSLLSDDVETDDAGPGENLKLRLKGIEEEEILPGFILCSPDNLCHSGRTFDAQVMTTDCHQL